MIDWSTRVTIDEKSVNVTQNHSPSQLFS